MTIEGDAAPRDQAPEAMPDWPAQCPMLAFTVWWDAVFAAWQPAPFPNHA